MKPKHNCPTCGRETTGSVSLTGSPWAICQDCYDKDIAPTTRKYEQMEAQLKKRRQEEADEFLEKEEKMICPQGHRFKQALYLKGKKAYRIVCPICKVSGCTFDLPETKHTFKVNVGEMAIGTWEEIKRREIQDAFASKRKGVADALVAHEKKYKLKNEDIITVGQLIGWEKEGKNSS